MATLIAGASGMVGSALARKLEGDLLTPSRKEVDFLDQRATFDYLQQTKPQAVVVAAARVGGIHANATYPAQFLYDNLAIAANLIHGAHLANVNRLLFLGSSCIYPKMAPQPIPEAALMTGPLEPTNEPYAIAKIAGVKLCAAYHHQYGRDYISAMPTNLYGPGDNYHPENSHVVAALLKRFMEAEGQVTVWGTGTPKREFLHVDDLADACAFLLDRYHETEPINVGSGEEVTIRELAELIAELVDFRGEILFDPSRLDGTPRKRTDTSRIEALGWRAKICLREGLQRTLAQWK